MVSRMRSNRSHTGNRRSHHKVDEPRLSQCECGAWHLRHHACQACGKYRGHQVVDVVARTERLQKRAKRREHELMASGQLTADQSTKLEEKVEAKEVKKANKKKEVAEKAEKAKSETTDKRAKGTKHGKGE